MFQENKYPPSFLEAIALHTFLNTAGYSLKEEVFLVINSTDVLVLLQAESKEAYFRAGSAKGTPEEMRAQWTQFISEWNTGGTMTIEEKDLIYKNSRICGSEARTLEILRSKGFKKRVPRDDPSRS